MEVQAYSPQDIEKILGLCRSQTYRYLNTVEKEGKPFRILRIGQVIRIPKESFDKWFYEGT